MSNPAHPADRRHEFTVIMSPPLRSVLLAGVYALVGAVLIVLSLTLQWIWVITALGILILVFGLVVGGLAVAVLPRLRTTMIMEPTGLTLISGRRRRMLSWTDISDVAMADTRMVFRGRADFRDEVVLFDRRRTDARTLLDVVAAVQSYLDASRGYRS